MPRRAAAVTQADIARAIRALRDAGAPVDRVRVRLEGSEAIVEESDAPAGGTIPADQFLAEQPEPPPAAVATIYVVGFSSYVKIGWSKEPDLRKVSLENGLPYR